MGSMLRSLLNLMLMSRFQLSHTSTLSQLLLILPPLLMPDMLLALLTSDMLESQLLLDMPVSQLSLDMLVSPLFLDMLDFLPFLGMLVSPLLMDMLVMGMLPPLDMLTKELTNHVEKTHPWKAGYNK